MSGFSQLLNKYLQHLDKTVYMNCSHILGSDNGSGKIHFQFKVRRATLRLNLSGGIFSGNFLWAKFVSFI